MFDGSCVENNKGFCGHSRVVVFKIVDDVGLGKQINFHRNLEPVKETGCLDIGS